MISMFHVICGFGDIRSSSAEATTLAHCSHWWPVSRQVGSAAQAVTASDVPGSPPAVVHIPGPGLQQSSHQPTPGSEHFVALPCCSHGYHYPSQRLAGANTGTISPWNEKNVDNGPSRGSCFHNSYRSADCPARAKGQQRSSPWISSKTNILPGGLTTQELSLQHESLLTCVSHSSAERSVHFLQDWG